MPKPSETNPVKQAILERRARVNEAYLRGVSQMEIAKTERVSQPVVSRDLKALREMWIERSVTAIGERKAIELAKIDALELTYWEAWDRSRVERESITVHKTGEVAAADGKVIGTRVSETRRREAQTGDAAFLAGIMTCIEKRCKILGLDAPSRNLNVDLSAMSDDQLERLAAGADIIDVLAVGGGNE